MKRLLGVIEKRGAPQNDIFAQLFTSKQFTKHLKDTLTLFHQDRTQFVDPFATYPE